MDITRDTINKIEELVNKNSEINTKEINGRIFTSNENLSEIREPVYRIDDYYEFNNISSLFKYLSEIKNHVLMKGKKVLISVDNCRQITAKTLPDEHGQSERIAIVKPKLPSITFNCYLSLEEFIIQLQTKFVKNENQDNLLSLVSRFQRNTEVKTEDDGITQRIVVSEGAGLQATNQVPPIVRLIAYRTFREIEQPDTMYLLRVAKDGAFALFEADGGAWEFDAQNNLRCYLEYELENDYPYLEDFVVIL